MKMKTRGFTLIEILVVTTIIGLLATTAVVAYSSLIKQSRDARRSSDLEQIRSALELYKGEKGSYPETITFGGVLSYNGNTYLSKIPQDPQPNNYSYFYMVDGNKDYILGTYQEQSGSTCTSGTYSCAPGGGGAGNGPGFGGGGGGPIPSSNCNYCLGPNGPR